MSQDNPDTPTGSGTRLGSDGHEHAVGVTGVPIDAAGETAAERTEASMDAILDPLVEDFRRFYREHVPTGDPADPPVYTFFTTGLVHWAVKMLEFYPARRNLVLIGGDLTGEELAWVRSKTDRPLFNVPRPADDKVAWELLFRVNETDFGWIDADCFLLDEALLDEMIDLPDDVAVNSIWSHRIDDGLAVPYPHFTFVNHSVLHSEGMEELGVGGATYRYEPGEDHLGRQARWGVHRVLGDEAAAAIDRVLGKPWGEREEPYFNERPFFEPLQAFTLAAIDRGYRLNQVRSLGDRRDEDHWSDQIIHVSSVAYVTHPNFPWDRFPKVPRQRYMLILVADQLLLMDYAGERPDAYDELEAERMRTIEHVIQRKTNPAKMTNAARALMSHVVGEDDIAHDDRWSFVRDPAEPVGAA